MPKTAGKTGRKRDSLARKAAIRSEADQSAKGCLMAVVTQPNHKLLKNSALLAEVSEPLVRAAISGSSLGFTNNSDGAKNWLEVVGWW